MQNPYGRPLCPCWRGDAQASYYRTSRHPDCPLVEIPPHGRLIDADALKNDGADVHMDFLCDGYVEDTIWGYSDDLIDKQPTIIEAEE